MESKTDDKDYFYCLVGSRIGYVSTVAMAPWRWQIVLQAMGEVFELKYLRFSNTRPYMVPIRSITHQAPHHH